MAVQDPSPSVRPAELYSSTEDKGPVTAHGALTPFQALLIFTPALAGGPRFAARLQVSTEKQRATCRDPVHHRAGQPRARAASLRDWRSATICSGESAEW